MKKINIIYEQRCHVPQHNSKIVFINTMNGRRSFMFGIKKKIRILGFNKYYIPLNERFEAYDYLKNLL